MTVQAWTVSHSPDCPGRDAGRRSCQPEQVECVICFCGNSINQVNNFSLFFKEAELCVCKHSDNRKTLNINTDVESALVQF